MTGSFLILGLLFFGLNARGGVPFMYPDGRIPPGWFGGVIPYVLDENLPDGVREAAARSMAAWTEATVLRFVPRTDESDFIHIVEDWADCVRQPSCFVPSGSGRNSDHGLGHGLGLEHEQQRRDRGRYLRVFQRHISPHKRWTWNPRPFYHTDISPYNYQSVMHYDFLSSKRNRRGAPRAVETIPPHMPVGQISYLSPGGRNTSITPGDADTVARMFRLTPQAWTVSTNPLGLAVIVDGEEVTAPATFDWSPGSEHTLRVPSPQVRSDGRYRFGRWSDAGGSDTRTIFATTDTTLYEANFVAAHRITTRVRPEGAGTVTISPESSDGYYPLRSEVTMAAEPTAGSDYRFLRWEISSDYLWQFLVTHETHGISANPAHTYAMPGLVYTAVFTRGAILSVESNADPLTVEVAGNEYRTPVALEASSLPERVTVALGRDFLEHDKGYRDRFQRWSDGGDESHVVDVSRTGDTILKLMVETEYRLVTEAWRDRDGNAILVAPPSEDGFYPEGTEVRLTASARPPAKFIGWNGDVAGREPQALVVMDEGKLAEAAFALDASKLRPGVPVEVSLRWNASDRDVGELYYVEMPPEASELEIEFSTGTATPGAEAGLFVESGDLWPSRVRHEDAHRILRDGVVRTVRVRRPPSRWPAAYVVLVRGAESDRRQAQTLDGTLTARVRRYGEGNRLVGGQQLRPGQFIQARAEACRLSFQTDGNLVASKNLVAYWSAGTRGASGGVAVMQSDGNFIVRDADGVAHWSTGTRSPGAYLGIQNDCNVVLRSAGGAALWASGRP